MAHAPTFYHLFRRSRYSVVDDGASFIEVKRNRVEEFVVSALGFTLQHDAGFRSWFLSTICGVPKNVVADGWEIACQNGHCSDLAILFKHSLAISIEAKVDSFLDEHQKPWSDRFKAPGKPDGYGLQLARRFSGCEDIRYIVIQKDLPEARIPESVTVESKTIVCSARTWRDLGTFEDRNSPFVRDFMQSVGEFGVPSLKLRRFHNMNMVAHTRNAADMHQLLAGVASSVGFNSRKLDWQITSGSDGAYFGLHLSSGSSFRQLEQLSGVTKGPVGWFGYEMPVNKPPRLTVWVYPAKNRLNAVRKFLINVLKLKPTKADDSLYVTSTKKDNDAEWFESTLKKLCDSSVA